MTRRHVTDCFGDENTLMKSLNHCIPLYVSKPPTHEPYLPLLPSRKTSPPSSWYSLRLPMKGWPGWVDFVDVHNTATAKTSCRHNCF